MTDFQKAFAVLAALFLSVAFAHAGKTGEQKSSGTSTGGSTGSPSSPSTAYAPKKNNVSTVKTKSMQKRTRDKAEAGGENIKRAK